MHHLLVVVLTTVVSVPVYFVDTTVLVKALVVSNVFALFTAWVNQVHHDRKVVLIDGIMAELKEAEDYFSCLRAKDVSEPVDGDITVCDADPLLLDFEEVEQ